MAHANLLKTAVLSTMSILIMPLEASAETCQPTNSFAVLIAVHTRGFYLHECASLQRLVQYREAMSWYYKVLELSKQTGEDFGCTEAYGAIADCYAELGDLERAAKMYDEYISRLQPRD